MIKVRSLKSLGKGSLYWWVEQCVPTLQDQRSGESRDALRFGFTGWLYLCRLLLNNLCMDDLLVRFTTCLAAMDAQLLSSCQDCSGVEDSLVVNNSRIE